MLQWELSDLLLSTVVKNAQLAQGYPVVPVVQAQSFYVISKQSYSRAYFPASKWDAIKSELLSIHSQLKMGEVSDFSIFVSAVIDENSFDRIEAHIQAAKDSDKCEIIAGGNCDKSKGMGYL